MRPVTQKQYTVYTYIARYIEVHGYSPTYSDITRAIGMSSSDIQGVLWHLREGGYISYFGGNSRMIYLTPCVPQPEVADTESKMSQLSKAKRAKRSSKPRPYSPRRQEVYHYIGNYVDEHRYPPVIREIAKGVGIGTTTVKYYLDMLREQGYLTYMPGKSRSIALTDKPFTQEKIQSDRAGQAS